MTTNAGAADMAKAAIGFKSSKREGDDMEAINRLFTPEFRNRLDAIIRSAAAAGRWCSAWSCRSSSCSLKRSLPTAMSRSNSEEAIAWLAIEGYDEQWGAAAGRVIQEHIKKPLADEVLFGKLI
jgi:ATP-dependent Clp protease ATP-binding subunit ClpA